MVTAIILAYTLRGGLKAVAWTDVLQGLLMFGLMAWALVLVTAHHGGWEAAFSKVRSVKPELFSRPGLNGAYSPAIWFSFIFLWFFCDPMFPQLFQRFYAAKNEKGLARSMLLYPLVCTLVFALPVAMGVLGWLDFPGLAGRQSDNIVPMMMTKVAGDFMGTMVLAAGLAALMSTMDSQLLTLGSIFSRDLLPLLWGKKAEKTLVGAVVRGAFGNGRAFGGAFKRCHHAEPGAHRLYRFGGAVSNRVFRALFEEPPAGLGLGLDYLR